MTLPPIFLLLMVMSASALVTKSIVSNNGSFSLPMALESRPMLRKEMASTAARLEENNVTRSDDRGDARLCAGEKLRFGFVKPRMRVGELVLEGAVV